MRINAEQLDITVTLKLFQNDVSKLPQPVTSQVVHLTGKEFQFAVFQLNNLDLEDALNSKVKNVVWLTDKVNLFSKIENQLGLEVFEGYNPEVFRTFAGMYLSETM
jgi:acetamidase/formamidase